MILAVSRRTTLVLFVLLAAGLGAWVVMGERSGLDPSQWSCAGSGSRSGAGGGGGGGEEEGGDEGGGQGRAGRDLPPDPREDPSYQGPSPTQPWREGEFAQKAGPASPRPPRPEEEPATTIAAMEKALSRAHGKVGYLADSSAAPDERWLSLLGSRLLTVDPREIDEAGTTIEAVAWRLRGRGADFLLVDAREPEPNPWLDTRATTLRSRLRDALPMTHFHPLVRGATHTLYRIGSPLALTQAQGKRLVAYVRAKLGGREARWPDLDPPVLGVNGEEHRVALSLRSFGTEKAEHAKLGWRSSAGETLREAVDGAISRLDRHWEKMREKAGFSGRLRDALDRIEVEVDVFRDVCDVTDRDPRRLLWNLELGYEGAFVVVDDTIHVRLPSDALQGGVETEAGFVERLEKNASLPAGSWRNADHRFGRFSTLSFVEVTPGGDVVQNYRGNPLVRVSEITRERLARSLTVGARWLWRNQLSDGQFRYRYKPLRSPDDRWQEGNNIVRHALNPYTLMLVQKIAPDDRLVASARRGLQYTFAHLQRRGSRCYVWHTDVPAKTENAKMGTVAVTILSIISMAEGGVDIRAYQDELRCLAQELLYMQDPNGHFRQYDVPRDHSYFGSENTIFPGEIMFALARMYGRTGEHKYKDAFDRALGWYREWWAYRSARKTEDGIYTEKDRQDLVGYVPWGLMALDAMHRKSPEEKYVQFAAELQDWMDGYFLFDHETSPYPDYLGAYFKRHDELPAINGCGYTEGAAAAFAIAKRVGRDVDRRRRALVLGVRFALQLQYTWRGNMYWIPDPGTALGGYRFHLTATRLRNDYSYHAMSAIAQGALYLDESDYPARTPIVLPEALWEAQ